MISRIAVKQWPARPQGTAVYRELAAEPIPHLDQAAVSAAHVPPGQRMPEPSEAARALEEKLLGELSSASMGGTEVAITVDVLISTSAIKPREGEKFSC